MKQKAVEEFMVERGIWGKVSKEDIKELEKFLASRIELAICQRYHNKFKKMLESKMDLRDNVLRLKRNCETYINKIKRQNGIEQI